MEDDTIRTLVARLSRPHASGGEVIERAAILAEGSESSAVLAWITAHGAQAEAQAPVVAAGGMYGARRHERSGVGTQTPLRYVLPPGALS